MLIKRMIALLIAMPVVVGGVLLLTANKPEELDLSNHIQSNGRNFPIEMIDAIPVATETREGEGLPVVGDIETLLKLLKDRGALYDSSDRVRREYSIWGVEEDSEIAFDMASDAGNNSVALSVPGSAPAPQAESQSSAGGGEGGSHSQTNEQVAGVSEGDIVKTDGRYIYAMSPYSNSLRIIRADGANMEVVSTISYEGISSEEFYLIGNDRLAVIGSEYVPIKALPNDGVDNLPTARIAPMPDYHYGWYSNGFTVIVIIDISDRTEPSELRRISMEGWKVSSRVIGGVVYMVTNKYVYGIPYDQADSTAIMPYCADTADGEDYVAIAMDRIFYIPDTDDTSYLLIGAIDIYGDEPFEPTAFLGAGSNFYMSQNAMYVTNTKWVDSMNRSDGIIDWDSYREKTDIMRFAINGTEVAYTGTGTVDGSPINQYSMDEFNGYFRIATTDWSAGTYVTVLNAADMSVVGRTAPLAPGERMQSMRFMGNMGYVVTFENVDPLFTIDLTNPQNPVVLGELKIPGFSQYLHPVGNGLMLGIGRDTQELYTRDSNGVETVVGFRDVGLKVSLFDVSNPYDPKEIDMMSLGEGWTEVSHNPRALMCDPSRGLFGFLMEGWNSNNSRGWYASALILQVENEQISLANALTLDENVHLYGGRLCFIGNTLYLVHNYGIAAYDYNSYAKLGSITF